MFEKNEPFQNFKQELSSRGVTIRWLWSTKTHSKRKYDDMWLACFIGDGFTPAITTAIIVDYDDSFGMFLDRGGHTISEDAAMIAGVGKIEAA